MKNWPQDISSRYPCFNIFNRGIFFFLFYSQILSVKQDLRCHNIVKVYFIFKAYRNTTDVSQFNDIIYVIVLSEEFQSSMIFLILILSREKSQNMFIVVRSLCKSTPNLFHTIQCQFRKCKWVAKCSLIERQKSKCRLCYL